MVKYQLLIGAALVAGVAIGYFVHPSDEPRPAPEPARKAMPAKPKSGVDPHVEALKSRIAELEKRLSALSVAEAGPTQEDKPAPDASQPPPRPVNPLEEMKKNDPARYAQVTNRMANWRRHYREGQQAKLDFLGSIDVSGMGERAKKTHERLQDLIISRDEIEEGFSRGDLSEEERRELFGKLRENGEEMRKVAAEERRNLLNEFARTMGLEGDAASEFSESVREIVNATEVFGFGGRRGHPGRGR